ncbi:MAG: insulinase family protein [Maricaulaceae bacterium]
MFKSLKLKSLFFSALVGLSACKSDNNTQKSELFDFAHEVSDLPVDSEVTYGKLPNGLRYILRENNLPTNTISLRMGFLVGSINETDETRGLAHFLEHMAFNGSTDIPEGELIPRLERNGLAFGADTNASTGFFQTTYQLDLPEADEALMQEGLFIMRQTASELTLDSSAIDRERGIIQAERRRRLGPAYDASIASFEYFLEGTIIPDRLPIGTEETIDTVQESDFKEFYEKYYRPDNSVIVIVGDNDVATMEALIKENFSDWTVEGEPPAAFEAKPVAIKGKEAIYYHDPEISTGISLNAMSEPIVRKDTAENRKISFIEGLGNRILSRRLSTLAQSPEAPFIGAGVSTSFVFDTQTRSSVSMSMRPEMWEEALAVAEQELRRAIDHGFSQAELDEQLANSRKSAEVAVQTSPTRRTAGLAGGLLNSFYGESVVTSPEDTYERFLGFVDDISLEDVERSFKQAWANYQTPQIYMNTPLVIENAQDAILKSYDASAVVEVAAPESKEAKAFAYTDFGPAGEIISREVNDEIGFETVTFKNNVVLNFKQTDFQEDVISIRVRIDGTTLTFPQELISLSGFASTALNSGGLGEHSNDELRTILAGKAIGAGVGLGQGSFSISGATVPEDLADQLNLMVARMIDPGYREEALSRYVKSIENVFNTLETTPQSTAGRYLGQILRDGNPRYRSPEKDEYLTASLAEVQQWATPYLETGAIEIGVVGDFDPERLVSEIARTFGALPERNAEFKEVDLSLRQRQFPKPTQTPIELYHKGDKTTSQLAVYWSRPPYNSHKDWPRAVRIGLINSMLRLRLTEVLREDEGATYSPSVSSSASELFPNYAFTGVSIEVSPEKIDHLYGVIDQVTGEMHRGEFDADLLDRARKPILERFETNLENNSYWMGVISRANSEPWSLEPHLTREDVYRSITAEELKTYSSSLYDPKTAVRVKIIKGDPEKNKQYAK